MRSARLARPHSIAVVAAVGLVLAASPAAWGRVPEPSSNRAPAVAVHAARAGATGGRTGEARRARAARRIARAKRVAHARRVAQAGRIAQAKLVAAAVRSAEAEARTGPDEGTPSKATDPTPPPAGAPGQASGAAGAACPDTELIPASGNLDRVAASALCLINQQRASAGEPPLRRNAALTLADGSYSLEMVTENFFGHVSPVGGGLLDRLRASGYVGPGQTLVGGENIDVAAGAGASPRASVDRWMNQSDHRANILNPAFRDSGIGVVAAIPALLAGGPGATYTNELGVLR